jgi:hypothetical protein
MITRGEYRSPFTEVMETAVDLEEDFIEVPSVAGPWRLAAQGIGISLTKLERPLTDGFVGEVDAAHPHHFFNIAEAEGEAKVQPYTMADDFRGEAMTAVKRGRGLHQRSMVHEYAFCTIWRLN